MANVKLFRSTHVQMKTQTTTRWRLSLSAIHIKGNLWVADLQVVFINTIFIGSSVSWQSLTSRCRTSNIHVLT